MPKQITTAIPYMTGSVHIGNTMDHILADILTRYHRLASEEVQFLAGSDEHGVKVYNKAKEQGIEPIDMLDANVDLYRNALDQLNIHPDDFVRTTDQERHWPVAQEVWRRMVKK